jgi:hypothetical protein
MTTLKPYVGVAGFMQTSEIMAAIETMPKSPRHNLAIGILASAKTLRGEINKHPNRYPKVADIADMVRPAREVVDETKLPVEFILHYAVDDIGNVGAEIDRLAEVVKTSQFDGVQINVPPHWADHLDLAHALRCLQQSVLHKLRIILQVRPPRRGQPMVDLIGMALHATAQNDEISDILIDASAGQGVELNGIYASDMIHAFRASLPIYGRSTVGIGVAGGLRPGKVGTVYSLMTIHGPLNFDVESGVRLPGSDHMSIEALRAYLAEAWQMVGTEP